MAIVDLWLVAQVLYLTLHCADWNQTLQIAEQPNKYKEYNLVLGEHPSKGRVNSYFITTAVGHTAVSYALKDTKYSKYWQGGTMALEAVVVGNNYNVGLQVKF